jgi:hypothetical protein
VEIAIVIPAKIPITGTQMLAKSPTVKLIDHALSIYSRTKTHAK